MITIIENLIYCAGILALSMAFISTLAVLFFEPVFLRKEHGYRKMLHLSALDDKLVLFEEDAMSYCFIVPEDLSLKIVLKKNNEQLFLYDGAGECLLNEYPTRKNPFSVIGFMDRNYSREIRMKLKDLVVCKG